MKDNDYNVKAEYWRKVITQCNKSVYHETKRVYTGLQTLKSPWTF